jgi:hypothetical protein
MDTSTVGLLNVLQNAEGFASNKTNSNMCSQIDKTYAPKTILETMGKCANESIVDQTIKIGCGVSDSEFKNTANIFSSCLQSNNIIKKEETKEKTTTKSESKAEQKASFDIGSLLMMILIPIIIIAVIGGSIYMSMPYKYIFLLIFVILIICGSIYLYKKFSVKKSD